MLTRSEARRKRISKWEDQSDAYQDAENHYRQKLPVGSILRWDGFRMRVHEQLADLHGPSGLLSGPSFHL